MDYDQRQHRVETIRQVLDGQWDGAPATLRRQVVDQPEDLRRDLYALYWRWGTASRDPAKRAAVVELMLGRVGEETPMLRGQLLKWLQDFRQDDFNQRARSMLSRLPWTAEYCPQAIRLIGIAGLIEAKPRLQAQIAGEPLTEPPPRGYPHKNTWAALLALARMGDDSALAAVLAAVRQEQDIVTRATVLFEDLGYTRRPAAFDLLKIYINSDRRLPQVTDTVPGQLEAARAAAVLARYVRGFPIQETDFNERETYQARAWVNAQGAWQLN